MTHRTMNNYLTHTLSLNRQRGGAKLLLIVLILPIGLLAAGYAYVQRYPSIVPDWMRSYLSFSFSPNTTAYRWQDEKGEWHYTNTPPDNRTYETLRFRNDANQIQGGMNEPSPFFQPAPER